MQAMISSITQSAYSGSNHGTGKKGVAIPKGEPEERIKHIDIILEE